jgi:hypothetical protein
MNYGGIAFIIAAVVYWVGAAIHTVHTERKQP